MVGWNMTAHRKARRLGKAQQRHDRAASYHLAKGAMTPKEVERVLRAHQGKRVRITFDDGVIHTVDIHSVDDEGFLHSGPNGVEPAHYWTRFDSVREITLAEVAP
jgi:hypothetical protein